ncbi:MAG: hypothetical protein QNJ56_07710 [Gammaproteobacteria bacterium]|nr:hypothetical protein [Gammaproteobacteria bacterium]
MTTRIVWLRRLIRLLILLAVLSLFFVMLDYATDDPSINTASMTRVPLPELELDKAFFIRLENKQVVVIRYSTQLQKKLFASDEEDDASFPKFFVAFAYGTSLGCPLELSDDGKLLKESCSQAYYDFAGQPADPDGDFTALRVPVYTFCPDYSCLNIKLN